MNNITDVNWVKPKKSEIEKKIKKVKKDEDFVESEMDEDVPLFMKRNPFDPYYLTPLD